MKNLLKHLVIGLTLISAAALIGCGEASVEHAHGDHDHSDHDHSDHDHSEMAAMASEPNDPSNTTSKAYPLDKCLVSGEALGSMGDPTVLTHNGQEVKLCCSDCVDGFKKEPEKYLAMLKEGTTGSDHAHENSSEHQH